MDRLISFISKCMRLSLTFVYHMASPALHTECDLLESRVSAFEKRGPRQASETRRGGGTKSVVQRAKQGPRHAMQERSAVRKKESLHGRRKHVN